MTKILAAKAANSKKTCCTPRTDAFFGAGDGIFWNGVQYVPASFARELERALTRLEANRAGFPSNGEANAMDTNAATGSLNAANGQKGIHSGPEGRAGETSGAGRSGDHDSSPDATRVAGNESGASSLTSNAQPPSLSAVTSEPK